MWLDVERFSFQFLKLYLTHDDDTRIMYNDYFNIIIIITEKMNTIAVCHVCCKLCEKHLIQNTYMIYIFFLFAITPNHINKVSLDYQIFNWINILKYLYVYLDYLQLYCFYHSKNSWCNKFSRKMLVFFYTHSLKQ